MTDIEPIPTLGPSTASIGISGREDRGAIGYILAEAATDKVKAA